MHAGKKPHPLIINTSHPHLVAAWVLAGELVDVLTQRDGGGVGGIDDGQVVVEHAAGGVGQDVGGVAAGLGGVASPAAGRGRGRGCRGGRGGGDGGGLVTLLAGLGWLETGLVATRVHVVGIGGGVLTVPRPGGARRGHLGVGQIILIRENLQNINIK